MATSPPQKSSMPSTTIADDEKNLPETQIQTNSDDEAHVQRRLRGFTWFLVVMVVLLPTFLYALDNTTMANVRPSIIDTFSRIDMLTWLSISYPMGEVGASPLWFVTIMFVSSCAAKSHVGESSMISSTIRSSFSRPCLYSKLARLLSGRREMLKLSL